MLQYRQLAYIRGRGYDRRDHCHLHFLIFRRQYTEVDDDL